MCAWDTGIFGCEIGKDEFDDVKCGGRFGMDDAGCPSGLIWKFVNIPESTQLPTNPTLFYKKKTGFSNTKKYENINGKPSTRQLEIKIMLPVLQYEPMEGHMW